MFIISITPEIAFDEFYSYAGGLGVLEGDKFYAASRINLRYVVLSIMYRKGYVDYTFDNEEPIPRPQKQPESIRNVLSEEEGFTIKLRGDEVVVKPWVYKKGSAKAVLFEAISPTWARVFSEQVYVERNAEEQFLKYAFLAKASAKYIQEYIGIENIDVIDLQESFTALITLVLPLNKYRLIIHTPGPWGHPTFPREFIEKEFEGFNTALNKYVVLTEIALEHVLKAFTVSEKHMNVMKKVFPKYANKITWVTNGIDLERWMDHRLYLYYIEKKLDKLDIKVFSRIKEDNRKQLENMLKNYKSSIDLRDKFVVSWARRLTRYKRPYFISRFIEEHSDIKDMVFVLGGKPHPKDNDGLGYAKTFRRLHLRLPNVIYIHDYDVQKAKTLFKGVDLLLFTPFSGWEACGTSYMKAGVNGSPVLSSRDGATLEVIRDGVNSWFYGKDLREFINIYTEPKATEIDETEYMEFKKKLLEIYDLYNSDREKYFNIALNAIKSFTPIVDIERALRQYYNIPSS